jgi:hypothetical protein
MNSLPLVSLARRLLGKRDVGADTRETLGLSQCRSGGRLRVGCVLFLIFVTQACATEKSQGINIIRETILSPGHSVNVRSITRTVNGDVVVVGSTGEGDPWPWATRIGADGKPKWEFVPGGPANPFMDVSVIGQIRSAPPRVSVQGSMFDARCPYPSITAKDSSGHGVAKALF